MDPSVSHRRISSFAIFCFVFICQNKAQPKTDVVDDQIASFRFVDFCDISLLKAHICVKNVRNVENLSAMHKMKILAKFSYSVNVNSSASKIHHSKLLLDT